MHDLHRWPPERYHWTIILLLRGILLIHHSIHGFSGRVIHCNVSTRYVLRNALFVYRKALGFLDEIRAFRKSLLGPELIGINLIGSCGAYWLSWGFSRIRKLTESQIRPDGVDSFCGLLRVMSSMPRSVGLTHGAVEYLTVHLFVKFRVSSNNRSRGL